MIRYQMQSTYIKDSVQNWIHQLQQQYDVLDVIHCDAYAPDSIELYNKIKSNYREVFTQNQRLVILFTKDYHTKYNPYVMFQSIQVMLNEIDISNSFVCIVSTDPDLHTTYDWIAKNISTDPIPVHLYQANGVYTNTLTTNTGYQKWTGLDNSDVINTMAEREKNLLLNSKIFCILPWISQYVTQDNGIKPCCHYSKHEALGNANIHTLKEVWNNKNTRQLRLDMINEKPIKACQTCYTREQNYKDNTSFRISYNRRFIKHHKIVSQTKTDGSLNKFDLKNITYKPNNLCNLQCRMCNINDSTSFFRVEKALGKNPIGPAFKQQNQDLLRQYMQHVDSLEQVIFEGGEPLMMEETYDFVDMLAKHKRHDVLLQYITNMTKTGLGGRRALDLWQGFKNISIYASLDGEYDRGKYLRPGSYSWQQIIDFRQQILTRRPDIFFSVHSTLTILNALHMPDFHRNWVEQGLVKAEHWIVNTLIDRPYLRVTTAPNYLKKKIKEKYIEHLKWLRPRDPYGKSTSGYVSILNALEIDEPFNSNLFWDEINKRDAYHRVNLLDTFPELVDLPH